MWDFILLKILLKKDLRLLKLILGHILVIINSKLLIQKWLHIRKSIPNLTEDKINSQFHYRIINCLKVKNHKLNHNQLIFLPKIIIIIYNNR